MTQTRPATVAAYLKELPAEQRDTYNGQPLCYVALAAQKHDLSLYLMTAYEKSRMKRARRA
jgi:hypothetical protein